MVAQECVDTSAALKELYIASTIRCLLSLSRLIQGEGCSNEKDRTRQINTIPLTGGIVVDSDIDKNSGLILDDPLVP